MKTPLIIRMIISSAFGGITTGLYMSLYGVIYLESGLESWQIGTIGAIFGLSTALFEIPLGTIADNYGRLRVYRLSLIIGIVANAILLWGYGYLAMIVYAFLTGLGVAVSTGTTGAWFVEEVRRQGKWDKLRQYNAYKRTTSLSVTVIFAFSAGYIPELLDKLRPIDNISGTKWIVLIILILKILNFFLSFWYYYEGETLSYRTKENRLSVFKTFNSALNAVLSNTILKEIMLYSMLMLPLAATIETYWQPRVYEFLPETDYRVFGWITTGFFAMQWLSSIIASFVSSIKSIPPLWFVRITMIVSCLCIFAVSRMVNLTSFVIWYYAFVILPIVCGPFIFELKHNAIKDEYRSTFISLQSFAETLITGLYLLAVPYLIKVIGISHSLMVTSLAILVVSIAIIIVFRKTVVIGYEQSAKGA